MAHLRQRMGCRRGQPWRAATHSTSDSPATRELFTGHYPSTRSGRGRRHASSQSRGPPCSTGSVIFTFNSSLHQSQITAHISMVFYETMQMEGSDTHTGGSGAAAGRPPAFQLGIGMMPQHVRAEMGGGTQDTKMPPIDPRPSV